MRHDIPHEVVHANWMDWSSAANLMSYAFAKFCPNSCDVAACSARPSGISASMEYVWVAPAKRSLLLFSPV